MQASAAGIALGVFAYGALTVHDATIKWLVALLPVWQVLFVRSAMIAAACLCIGRTGLLARAVRTPLKAALLFRGAITLAAWICYFSASRSLPLAQMTSLYFIAPVLVTVMAAPLLGERVGPARWISVLLGFAGVMAANDPLGVSVSLPALLVLVAASFWAFGIILMRKIARRESSLLQMLYTNLFFLAGTVAGTVLTWRAPTIGEAVLLLAVGGLGGLGQFALFEAARRAPASVMATVEYTALVWAFALGFVIWREVPHPAVWIGACLIVLAGLLLLAAERRAAARSSRRVAADSPAT